MSIKATADTHPHPVGAFAVMRHHANSKTMKFRMLHPTRAEAEDEARRLFVKQVEDGAPESGGFYVLEVVGRVGIFGGKLEG